MTTYQKDDILFVGVTVVDGSGDTAGYVADVLVRDGLIKSIRRDQAESESDSARQQGARVVDGESGRWTLSPGFIDMHAHSDLSLLHTPEHLAKITQGVTTEVIGQDGISYSPVTTATLARIREQIAGWNGNPKEPADFFERWRSVGEYLDVLDASRIATNAAYLVPQGNLRILAKGWDSSPATQAEIDTMKAHLHEAFRQGAVGMSSGLTYVPGMFADDAELAQLCRVVVQYGGYFAPHHRSYGKGAMQAYREMIELARSTGVRLHLTHATLNFAENRGRADEFLALLDGALAEGLDITLDTYPYLPGSTTLASLLPSWAAAADDKRALLDDPAQLARIRHAVLVEGTDGCHGCTLDWEIIEISGVSSPALLAAGVVGKRVAQLAREQGGDNRDPFDAFVDLLREDNFSTTIIQHAGHEGNVRRIMRHPRHTGGSDGILTSTKPHPRGWGTFPRYLGHYHRDLARGKSRDICGLPPASAGAAATPAAGDDDGDVFDDVEPETIFPGGLEEVVSHLTGRAAAVLRLRDRGLVREGYRADLVLFDAETVRDAATYADPKQPAKGIRAVLVNGVFAVEEGRATGARAGRTIRLREERDKSGKFVVG
ncbi:hypothetical protein SLS62_000605 [Diatrype stigma]|uniref:Amidohydrolase 3 domain-containing protein n=1 Tax=Diatrype stigma TaxID=117547 RepID=A0AAN9UXW7_9PEZI